MSALWSKIWGWVVALGVLVGIASGIYSYVGRETRELVVRPLQPVVLASASQPFSILYKGKPVNPPVTLLRFSVWNDGNSPIRSSDVRAPIVASVPKGSHVIHAQVSNTSRRVVHAQAKLAALDTEPISFSFDMLESDDGFNVSIVLDGYNALNANERVYWSGTVVGQPGGIKSRLGSEGQETDFKIVLLTVIVGSILNGLLFWAIRSVRHWSSSIQRWAQAFSAGISACVAVGLLAWLGGSTGSMPAWAEDTEPVRLISPGVDLVGVEVEESPADDLNYPPLDRSSQQAPARPAAAD